jgi:hypothetical protein
MYENSIVEQTENGEERIFRGLITEIFSNLGIANSNYSRVRQVLVDNGFIVYKDLGRRGVPSTVQLVRRPPDKPVEGLTIPGAGNNDLTLRAMCATLTRKVEALEAWREASGEIDIKEALRNIERRLAKLESD